ncbi:MAG: hypothetical protein KDC95_03780 [Planctomycetes bacterium]|nr:hypothetical protein [Planctomycetota bacterium]
MTDTPVPAAEPSPSAPPRLSPPPEPFERAEIDRALVVPFHLLEVVLAGRARLTANVAQRRHLGRLVIVLLIGSILFAIPYGLVRDSSRFLDVATLFVGTMGICLPSLIVFSAYLGAAIDFRQNFVLALVITTTAALFSFGFFPIVWFLDQTMGASNGKITTGHLSIVLLTLSLLAGVAQQHRCLFADKLMKDLQSNSVVLFVWQVLFVFMTYRMAQLLGIL